jgi:hypothetical protein
VESSAQRARIVEVDGAGLQAAVCEILNLAEVTANCGPGPQSVDLQAYGVS